MSKKNRSFLAGSLMPPNLLGNGRGEYTMGCMSPVTRLYWSSVNCWQYKMGKPQADADMTINRPIRKANITADSMLSHCDKQGRYKVRRELTGEYFGEYK